MACAVVQPCTGRFTSLAPSHGHRRAARVLRRASHTPERSGPEWQVHGRHVVVDEELRSRVIERLTPLVHKLQDGSAEFMEGLAGVRCVDVRLMNTSATIQLHAIQRDPHVHDTLLRQGRMEATAVGHASALEAFEACCVQLTHKLKRQTKAAPVKKNGHRHSNMAS